jgi:hypothetical protein
MVSVIKKEFKVPLAYIDLVSKEIIYPDGAEQGIDYYCPGCNTIVRRRESTWNNLHFYHLNLEKRCSLESIRHKLYKKAIIETKQFLTPCGTLLNFDKVEEEKNLHDFRPDVIGDISNKKYIIEVIKTSDISESKLIKIKKSNTVCFSIDAIYDDYNEIINHVTKDKDFKQAVYTSQIKELDRLKYILEQKIKYYESFVLPSIKENEARIIKTVDQRIKSIIENNYAMEYKKTCSNGWELYANSYNAKFVVFFNPEKQIMTFKLNRS